MCTPAFAGGYRAGGDIVHASVVSLQCQYANRETAYLTLKVARLSLRAEKIDVCCLSGGDHVSRTRDRTYFRIHKEF